MRRVCRLVKVLVIVLRNEMSSTRISHALNLLASDLGNAAERARKKRRGGRKQRRRTAEPPKAGGMERSEGAPEWKKEGGGE